jgi:hypothetical protein
MFSLGGGETGEVATPPLRVVRIEHIRWPAAGRGEGYDRARHRRPAVHIWGQDCASGLESCHLRWMIGPGWRWRGSYCWNQGPAVRNSNRHWRLTPLAGTANERSETVMPVCSKRLVRLSSVHVAVAGHGTPQQRSRSAGSFGMFALDDGEVESQLQLEGSGERLLPLQVVPLRRMLARGVVLSSLMASPVHAPAAWRRTKAPVPDPTGVVMVTSQRSSVMTRHPSSRHRR